MATSNFFIHYVLYPLPHYVGVYNTSTIREAQYKKLPCYVVSNLAGEGHPGTHWIGLVLFTDDIFYFDPLGDVCTSPTIIKFMCDKGYTSYKYMTRPIQNEFSSHCGYFVMSFFIFLESGRTMSDFFALFSDRSSDNDRIVRSIVDSYVENITLY